MLFFSYSVIFILNLWTIHSRSTFPHAVTTDLHVLADKTHHKASVLLSLPFRSPPTLNLHSQHYPRVFVDDVGHAHSRDDFQQVGGNSSIKSSDAFLGHNVAKQGQHGEFGSSLHWSWWEQKKGKVPQRLSQCSKNPTDCCFSISRPTVFGHWQDFFKMLF